MISANYVMVFAIFALPHLFPAESILSRPWWDIRGDGTIVGQTYWFYTLFAFYIPLVGITVKRVRRHLKEVWKQKPKPTAQKKELPLDSGDSSPTNVLPMANVK